MLDVHLRYVKNETTKQFKARTLKYNEHVCKNFDLDLYISPTSNNVENYYEDNWEDRDTLFYGGYYMRVDQ